MGWLGPLRLSREVPAQHETGLLRHRHRTVSRRQALALRELLLVGRLFGLRLIAHMQGTGAQSGRGHRDVLAPFSTTRLQERVETSPDQHLGLLSNGHVLASCVGTRVVHACAGISHDYDQRAATAPVIDDFHVMDKRTRYSPVGAGAGGTVGGGVRG